MWHALLGETLVAQVIWDVEFLLTAGGLACLICAGLWCILKVKRWGERQEAPSPQDDLAGLQALKDQGLLTEEEFDRIRARLDPQKPVDNKGPSGAVQPSPAAADKDPEPPAEQP